jgi:hypothetical protein
MAALVLFGAMVGISVAIGFTWIPISDALANFLGGVVGAGLGAALAVLGAVHVQRRERRDQLTAPVNILSGHLVKLRDHLVYLGIALGKRDVVPSIAAVEKAVEELSAVLDAVPLGAELPPSLHSQLNEIREELDSSIRRWYRHVAAWKAGDYKKNENVDLMGEVGDYVAAAQALLEELDRLA